MYVCMYVCMYVLYVYLICDVEHVILITEAPNTSMVAFAGNHHACLTLDKEKVCMFG